MNISNIFIIEELKDVRKKITNTYIGNSVNYLSGAGEKIDMIIKILETIRR